MTLWEKLQFIRKPENYNRMCASHQADADRIWEGLDGLGENPTDYVVNRYLYGWMVKFINGKYEKFKD